MAFAAGDGLAGGGLRGRLPTAGTIGTVEIDRLLPTWEPLHQFCHGQPILPPSDAERCVQTARLAQSRAVCT